MGLTAGSDLRPTIKNARSIHFVGICGTAMASVAAALKERWIHQFHGGPAPERDDIVLAALFDGAQDLKSHLREATWCTGHGKRVANWDKRVKAKAEAESGKKSAAKSADVAASNQFSALMAPGEKWGDSD